MTDKLPRHFKPLRRAQPDRRDHDRVILAAMALWGCGREEASARLQADVDRCEYFINDLYQVEKRRLRAGWVQLNIRSRNGTVIFRDWRHFQAIKNQLVGPECEAIEIYPAESRLVDTSNKYHLWCCTDPAFRFPIGFEERDVNYDDSDKTPGIRQRSY